MKTKVVLYRQGRYVGQEFVAGRPPRCFERAGLLFLLVSQIAGAWLYEGVRA